MKKKDKIDKKDKVYEDDDGRTIADMSGVDHPSSFLPRFPSGDDGKSGHRDISSGEDDRPWENSSLTKEERRAYILGALGAALLIGGIFIIVLGLLIWALLALWT